MSTVDLACRGVLVLVFVASAAGKLGNFGGFVAAVRQLRLVPGRRPPVRPVARVVVAAEGAAAALLLLPGAFATAGFVLVILLCAVFAVAIESSVRRDIRVPCPCFGASADLLDRRHLVRNAILAAVSVAGLADTGTGRPPGLVDVLVGSVAAVFVAAVVIRFDDVAEILVPRPAARR
ncbi:MauE/DoxX family redox-associated membrane protein [Actinophytocola sp.]|uniref:MauE/DoxX family redox-associated membrane protein n=1 Tax=Actinophytocola sp. TaxID=1872138 RepID=UPI002D5DD9A8|nr:MauE/DoxX family redox-associated membrane protein [Actinophytocola sp.]HYQ61848.1 MauE/DoxX family redox-associated membrane protein [Actinophytocola sp.]